MQRASPTLDERCKGGLDLAVAAGIEDVELLPHGRSRTRTSETSAPRGHLGSTSTAMRAAPGRSSRNSSPASPQVRTEMKLMPVTLPRGRLRLATRPP